MKRFAKTYLLATSVAAIGLFRAEDAFGQNAAAMSVRVYPVADLVFVAPDYPFQGFASPTSSNIGTTPSGGGGGFGGGGGQFGSSGSSTSRSRVFGTVQFTNRASAEHGQFDMDAITGVIMRTVSPETWDQSGGDGTIAELGSQLIIRQTSEVHDQVSQLLDALREEGSRGTVTVRAHWLLLNDGQYAELLADVNSGSPRRVNRQALQALGDAATSNHAELTCFDGQTVHVISGRVRSAVTSVIPVVGQVEDEDGDVQLAMVESDGDGLAPEESPTRPTKWSLFQPMQGDFLAQAGQPDSSVGYSPVITLQHSGVMLQVTPTKLPGANAVALDLTSEATRWLDEPDDEQQEFRGVVKLDRTDEISQRLSTTLRMPVGQPVLVGGLTLEPNAQTDGAENRRLYLVVEVTLGDA